MNLAAYLGIAATMVGIAMLLIAAFRVNKTWGIGSILMIPVGPLVFAVTHWRVGREGFILTVIGILTITYTTMTSDWWYQRQQAKAVSTQQQVATINTQEVADEQEQDDPFAKTEATPMEIPGEAINTEPPAVAEASTVSKPEVNSEPPAVAEKATESISQESDAAASTVTASAEPVIAPVIPEIVKPKVTLRTTNVILVYRTVNVADAKNYIGKNVRVTDDTDVTHDAILKELRGSNIVFKRLYESRGFVEFELKPSNIKKLEVASHRKKIN